MSSVSRCFVFMNQSKKILTLHQTWCQPSDSSRPHPERTMRRRRRWSEQHGHTLTHGHYDTWTYTHVCVHVSPLKGLVPKPTRYYFIMDLNRDVEAEARRLAELLTAYIQTPTLCLLALHLTWIHEVKHSHQQRPLMAAQLQLLSSQTSTSHCFGEDMINNTCQHQHQVCNICSVVSGQYLSQTLWLFSLCCRY